MFENFLVCLNAVLPLFIYMSVGYLARCAKIIDRELAKKFNKVAFRVFMAINVYNSIYRSDLSTAIRPKLMGFSVITILASFFLALAFSLVWTKDARKRGVLTQAIFRSNFALVGLPVAASLVNGGDVAAVAILVAIVIPMFNMLAVIVLQVFSGGEIRIREILSGIVKNPLIIATFLGIATIALGIRFPSSVEKPISQLAAVATPLMLFLLGADFRFDSLAADFKDLFVGCFGRLVAIPAIFLSLGYVLGFRGMEFAALLAIFTSSNGVSSFTMVQSIGGDDVLAGNIVVITNALCCFTMFAWCMLFKTLGAF